MNKFFKIISRLEALSAAALFFFAMPAKYYFEQPQFIFSVGMVHGILFLLFMTTLLICCHVNNWSIKTFLLGVFAAIIPLGTLLFEYSLYKKGQL